MFGLKRGAAVAVLSGAIAACAIASPAFAADKLTGACQFAGKASATVPIVGTPTGNTYTFNSLTFTCAGSLNGTTDVYTLSASSGGTFQNTVCGTGSASSTSATVGPWSGQTSGKSGNGISADLSYLITFAGGQGVLDWRNADTTLPDVHTATDPNTGLQVGGPVNIQPDYSGGVPMDGKTCTFGFTVQGALAYDNS